MTKPFLLSAAVHVIILGILFLSAASNSVDTIYTETINLRIRNQGVRNVFSGKVNASSPSESSRRDRKTASLPSFPGSRNVDFPESFEPANVDQLVASSRRSIDIPVPDAVSPEPLPGVSNVIDRGLLPAADPLAGLEKALPKIESSSQGNSHPWSISWVDGKERGIITSPDIKSDDFPTQTERLLDVAVKIIVSPQGDVISAEVLPPGSGDIRIDRRMYNAALQLVLEPWPEEMGEQEGLLHLKFLDEPR